MGLTESIGHVARMPIDAFLAEIHKYLAMMLGVPTHMVAEPMAALQAIGAVRFADDAVSIVSEARLRDAACECYAAPAEYAQRLETRPRVQRDAP